MKHLTISSKSKTDLIPIMILSFQFNNKKYSILYFVVAFVGAFTKTIEEILKL